MSIDNLLNVITRSAFVAIIAVGATFVISAGGLDLSVGSMVAFVASLMIMFMNSGVIADPATMLVFAVALAMVIGAACGLANGLITTAGSIEPFIATLGTMGFYRGLTTLLSQGGAITLRSPDIHSLYRPTYFGAVLGVPVPIIIIVVTAAVGAFVLHRTRYGRHVLARGIERGCSALFRHSRRTRAHDNLRHLRPVRSRGMSALRAAPGIHVSNDRTYVRVTGHHRSRGRWHRAARRRRPHLGHDLRSVHT